jgi:hypothetical protein
MRSTTRRGALFTRAMASAPPADDVCRYSDDEYEYRHVQLPKQMLKIIPKDYFDGARGTLKLLWEDEWRALGITQVRRRDETRRDETRYTDTPAESRMGTLRSPRARAAHPSFQVRPCPLEQQ